MPIVFFFGPTLECKYVKETILSTIKKIQVNFVFVEVGNSLG
jgi:hypothetical protein